MEPSRIEVEARSYELDPYGHVNNAVYLNWLEHGRLCYLRDRGESYTSIPQRYGVHVVVVRIDISYRSEVCLGDRLAVTTGISRFGNSSFTFAQQVDFLDGRPAAEAAVTMACVGSEGVAVAMPPGLRRILETPA